jgi:hypothetical protein
MLHPDDATRSLATLDRAVAEDSSYITEHRVVWPDGTTHWINGRGKAITDEQGEVIGTIGCSIDVTDRKLAEAASARRVREAEAVAVRERLQRERLEFLTTINDVARSASGHVDLMQSIATAAVPRLGDWCSVHYRPAPGAPHESVIAHVDPAKAHWATDLRDRFPLDPDSPLGAPARPSSSARSTPWGSNGRSNRCGRSTRPPSCPSSRRCI